MGLKKGIYIVVFAFLCLGCSNSSKYSGGKERIKSTFEIPHTKRAVLLIPLDGCSGCVKSTLEFVKLHQKNKWLYVVLSATSNKKINLTKEKYGLTESQNIFPDSDNLIVRNGYSIGTPMLAYLGRTLKRTELNGETVLKELTILNWNMEHWKKNRPINGILDLDITPSYNNDSLGLRDLVLSIVQYPTAAREVGIKGIAFVELIINEKGAVIENKMIKNFYNCCDDLFLQDLKSKATFNPGRINGIPVKSRVLLPIQFGKIEENN